MMPPWETRPVAVGGPQAQQAEEEEDQTWIDHVMASFDFLKAVLAKSVEIRRAEEAPPEHDEEPDEDRDPEDRDPEDRGPPRDGASRKRRHGPARGKDDEERPASPPAQGPHLDGASSSDDPDPKRGRHHQGRVVRNPEDLPIRVDYEDQAFQVVRVPPDGDCLYRCCVAFLADGRDVPALRQLLGQSAHLSNEEQQAALQPGAYAGDRELAALAHELQIAIVTHEGTYERDIVVPRAPVGVATHGTLNLLLIYDREDAQGHFDRLV